MYFSEFVTAGTNLSLPDNNATCAQTFQLVPTDICRVALYVSTSDQSGFNMEAWLPSNWTGRYLSTGERSRLPKLRIFVFLIVIR